MMFQIFILSLDSFINIGKEIIMYKLDNLVLVRIQDKQNKNKTTFLVDY